MVGSRQKGRAIFMASCTLLQRADKNRVKPVMERRDKNPAPAAAAWVCPAVSAGITNTELIICTEVLSPSVPKTRFVTRRKIPVPARNVTANIITDTAAFTTASCILPYFVQRRILSAPVWYSAENTGHRIITIAKSIRRKYKIR